VAAPARAPGLPSWNLVRLWRTSPLPGACPKNQRPTTQPQGTVCLFIPVNPFYPRLKSFISSLD